MIGMTLCSGIGAPEVAAPWVDWRFASEIEKFPRAVLQHRLGYKIPKDHNQGEPLLWGDMREVTPDLLRRHGVPLPNIVVAGTPCQAFSVAGARKGLEDPRGNLTLAFVDLLHAIVAARPDGKLAVLWENVPGVLSDKGNAFGCFLGGLIGSLDAIPAPAGGSWPSEGMVEGPRARAAWAVLDAQWFDVAQRRERVFVVVDFGGTVDPGAVLLEPDSLRGDSPPRREAGQVSPTIPARSTGGGGLGTDFDCDGGVIAVTHALRGEGFDASEDGTGRGTPIVPVVFDTTQITSPANYSNPQPGDPCHPLAAGAHPPAIAFDCKGTEVQFQADGGHPPLRSMGHLDSHQNAGGHAAVAYAIQERAVSENIHAGPQGKGWQEEVAYTLEARQQVQAAVQRWAVRRLMPIECARLQAFPDNHTQIPWRGKPAELCPDGPQYKAYGNSMATKVVKWIMDRMRISMTHALHMETTHE